MVTCIKQHLGNIWNSIYEKVKQHWGWVEKKVLLLEKLYLISHWPTKKNKNRHIGLENFQMKPRKL